MKRPLMVICIVLVILASVRLKLDMTNTLSEQKATYLSSLPEGSYLRGIVCAREEGKFYIKSIIILSDGSSPTIENPLTNKDKIILMMDENESISYMLGEEILFVGNFSLYRSASNPGEFDTAAYYASKGVMGYMKEPEVIASDGSYWPIREGLQRFREILHNRLYSVFPEREASVMCALLLGEKSGTDEELKSLFQRSGILHILSISSLHITILGMSLYRGLKKIGAPEWLAALCGCILLLLYGCMTGFAVSTCRAIGMYVIHMFGKVVGRTYDLLTSLFVLAAVLANLKPSNLTGAGFLLSFMAVIGVGAVYPVLMPKRRIIGKRFFGEAKWRVTLRRGYYGAIDSCLVSLSILLTTLPVLLWFYYEIPIWTVIINLFVIPLVEPLMLSGLASLIPGIGWIGFFDRLVIGWFERVCLFFDQFPSSIWNPGRPKIGRVIFYYVILCFALYFKSDCSKKTRADLNHLKFHFLGYVMRFLHAIFNRKPQIHIRLFHGVQFLQNGMVMRMARALGLIFLLLLSVSWKPSQSNVVAFLDVGQGDCSVIHTKDGATYIVDCGSSSRSSIGKYVLVPYLKYNGYHHIDGIFLSHPDEDHMNGILELLEKAEEEHIKIDALILPDIQEEAREEEFGEIYALAEKTEIAYLHQGMKMSGKFATIRCLHPAESYSASDKNNYSECLLLTTDGYSVLYTGDVSGTGEKKLASYFEKVQNPITILKVSHHGSKYSTSSSFLEAVEPKVSIISSAKKSRYGHPHQETLDRLEEANTQIYKTFDRGCITIKISKRRITIQRYLD